MSRLLETVCKEAKSGNKDLVNQVRHIGNKFLNAVEISAQEAVYLVLQMALRHSSRQVQFINTSIPDDRAFLLKPIEKLRDMPDNSDDIESDNVIKRYQRRPKKLKNLCLADFVAWYNCIKQNSKPTGIKTLQKSGEFLPENDFADNFDDDPNDTKDVTCSEEEYEIKGGFKLVKRTVPKVIRSVRYNKGKNSENHYREQFMPYAETVFLSCVAFY